MGTRVCVLGVGVIGTTYAYVLQKAGYEVFHLVRDHKVLSLPSELPVHLLDGRDNPNGEERDDVYHISLAETDATYDFIFVSVASGALEQALQLLALPWEHEGDCRAQHRPGRLYLLQC